MFDVLLKPKFYIKCKSCLKITKTRLEAIVKKRNAVQKFLKKDITDLLRSSLDHNAYGRAEGLLVEQNLSSCYELVAKFVGCILDHLRDLYKQRDCPDECKEAIPSLMYAAARFSDLPELRQLRTLFTEKFGKSVETYISKEFVDKLRQDPPSKEMKIQLLRDLAKEFSIEWDSKALEQKLHSPPVLQEEKPKYDSVNDHDGAKWQANKDIAVPKTDDIVTGGNQTDGRVSHTSKTKERDTLYDGRKDNSDASWRRRSRSDDETITDNWSLDGSKSCSSSVESVSAEEELGIKRPLSFSLVPPPYVKEKSNKKGESDLNKTTESKALAEKEVSQVLNEAVVEKKPIPRSVRRRPLKPPLDQKIEDSAKVDSSRMEPEKAKQHGLTELTHDGKSRDEEEKVMDRLLMHYSKKQAPYESSIGYDKVENRRHTKSNSCVTPVRAISLPPEDTSSKETMKVHERANSLAPEMLRTAGHVHPSLPDYDDLPALLTSLRGR